MSGNSGTSFGDNANISSSALAGGQGARAHNVVSYGGVSATETAELTQRVDRLIALLDAEVAQGRLSPEAAETGRAVKDQLATDKPNKLTLLSLLAGIAGAAGSLTTVVDAVSAVQGLITKLL